MTEDSIQYPCTDLLATAIAGLDAGDDGGPRRSTAAALARAVVAEDLPLVPLLPHGRGVRLAHGTARFQAQRHRRWMGSSAEQWSVGRWQKGSLREPQMDANADRNRMRCLCIWWCGDASGRPLVVTPARHRILVGSHPVLFIVTGTPPPLQTPECLFRLCCCRRNARRAPPLVRMNHWRDISVISCRHF